MDHTERTPRAGSSHDADPRLQALLGGDALAGLRRRLRRHFERLDAEAPRKLLRVSGLSALEHDALALLVGASPRAMKSMQIDLAALDTALRDAGIACSLHDALERLDGPIVHRASARAQTQARWAAVAQSCRHQALARLLEAPAALGLLKRLARQDANAARDLLERADTVLDRLPAPGVPRAQLAAQTMGDAHALDARQPVATLVLAAWRRGESEAPDAPDAPEDLPAESSDERTRDVWARAGVLVNELARPALFLNLDMPRTQAPLAPPGEPGYLSLRRLLRSAPDFDTSNRDVFVCENPNLVAIAAAQLGARCAPLVCTDGMPAAAQRTLLAQLTDAGARLHYHGDFDWPGLQIGNQVMRAFGARAWRFGAHEYETAVETAPHLQRNLGNDAVSASWDAALAPAMVHHGLAIAEEAVVACLIDDLRR